MIKISKTTSNLITLTFALIFVVVAYVFFFGEIRATNRGISSQEDSIDRASEQELKLSDLEIIVSSTKEKRNSLQEYILTEEGIVAFLGNIESLEQYTGAAVEVRSIKREENENFEFIEELSLDIQAEGSWEAVYHTFLLLEALPHKGRMTSVQFSKSGSEESDDNEWKGAFKLFVVKTK